MNNLFKKAALFTDIHVGLKSNSQSHNQDCEEFVDWFIETAKYNNCETAIFLGDFHHNRNSLNINTMNYSIRILEKLGQSFDQFFFFPGNHDLFYRDRRDIHSVEFGKHIPGVTVINKPTTMDGVTLCPWLVGDEWKNLHKHKSKYLFGHLELPHFYMNAMVKMPDHVELQIDKLKEFEYIFSGHFHKRQNQDNIFYIGNCFPHNYSDAGDEDRGMTILEWDRPPKYIHWPNQPTYMVTTLSDLLNNAETILKPKQHLRVTMDVDISYEEAAFVKEQFIGEYNLRELTLIPQQCDLDSQNTVEIEKFESVDQIVIHQLSDIQSETYDKQILLNIFENL